MALDAVIGNEKLRARLSDELLCGRLSHAYIIEGARGIGKHTLALQLCAALACEQQGRGKAALPCGTCSSCRKVLEGKSPDVTVIARDKDKASIGVDKVRPIRQDVYIEPNDLNNKVYIFEEADLLTLQAQNALLLTLEEPPPYVLFLLLCENASDLIETIRSRAPVLRMQPVGQRQMEQHLLGTQGAFRALTPRERTQVLQLSNGCIGRAEELLDGRERKPVLERREGVAAFLDAWLGRRNVDELLHFVVTIDDKREKKREEACAQLELLMDALCDLLRMRRAEQVTLRFFTEETAAAELAQRCSVQRLLELMDAAERARGRVLSNGNIKLILTDLALLA